MSQPKVQPKTYRDSFSGSFQGMLQWKQFDKLWDVLRAQPENWYVYQPMNGDTPPDAPLEKEDFYSFLQEADTFLHEEQFASYCGAVYVDDAAHPTFVKIFHPRKMGSGCSLGGDNHEPVLPYWTISRIQPTRMKESSEEKNASAPPASRGIIQAMSEKIGFKKP